MTDLSGIGSNLTFTNGIPPKAPYYYVTAHLDLSGVYLGDNESLTYYFNKDNNLSYLDSLVTPNYHNFHLIDSNAVIGDVVLYSNPDLVLGENAALLFDVGGAVFDPDVVQPALVDPVSALWGGSTGFSSGSVTAADINTGVICYYGHEGGHDPAEHKSDVNDHRYLAVTIKYDGDLLAKKVEDEKADASKSADSLESSRAAQRKKDAVRQLLSGGKINVDSHEVLGALQSQKNRKKRLRTILNPDITSGSLYVVVKVYPKAHP
jgi:hypothetical protein